MAGAAIEDRRLRRLTEVHRLALIAWLIARGVEFL
jgi:hypothetical protein